MHCSFSNFLKTYRTREKVINEKKVNMRDVMKSNEDKRMSQNQTSITGYLTADPSKKQDNVARPQAPQCKESHNLKINEDKPFHPPNDYIFPKKKSGDRLRPCQAHWFKQFPWLHYGEK